MDRCFAFYLPTDKWKPVREPLWPDFLQPEWLRRRIIYVCHDRTGDDCCWVPTWHCHDRLTGRRPLMIGGGLMCGILLSIGAALGSEAAHPNPAEKRTVIATFILLGIFTKVLASNNVYLIGAEIGGVKMHKKIMAFGTANVILATFIVTFVTPYLLANPGPNMGPKIGWIFAAAGYLSGLFGFFLYARAQGKIP